MTTSMAATGISLAGLLERGLPTAMAWLPPRLIENLVALALNRALQPTLVAGALTELEGRWLAVECRELPYSLRIGRRGDRLQVRADRGPTDVNIRGDAAAFLQLLRQQSDPDTLFFQRRLVMEGDTELALTIKNCLDSIEPPAWLRRMLAR